MNDRLEEIKERHAEITPGDWYSTTIRNITFEGNAKKDIPWLIEQLDQDNKS